MFILWLFKCKNCSIFCRLSESLLHKTQTGLKSQLAVKMNVLLFHLFEQRRSENKRSATPSVVLFHQVCTQTAQGTAERPPNPTLSPPPLPPQYLSAPRKLPGLAGARVLPHPSSLSGRVWLHRAEREERTREEKKKKRK